MADTQIPSSAGGSPQGKSASTKQGGITIARDITVEKLPKDLPPPEQGKTVRIQGEVTARNEAEKTITIKTDKGEVVIKTDAPLPEGTRVALDISVQKAVEKANLVLMREQAALAKALIQQMEQKAAVQKTSAQPTATQAPPPALRLDSTVIAVYVPMEGNPPKPVLPAPLPAQNTTTQAPSLPQDIADLVTTLVKEAESIKSFLPTGTQPETGLRQQTQNTSSQMPAGLQGVFSELDLINIIQAQLQGKLSPAQKIVTTTTPPDTPQQQAVGTGALRTLASLFMSENGTTPVFPYGGATQENTPIPQTQKTYPAGSLPVPDNFYQMTVKAVFPPDTPAETITQALKQSPQAQPAVVETVTPNANPILKTDTGHFVLRQPVNIPVGSIILTDITPMSPDQVMQHILSPQSTPDTTQTDGLAQTALASSYTGNFSSFNPLTSLTWPALQETLDIAYTMPENDGLATAVAGLKTALNNTLPSPTPRMTATALFFIAALRMGDIQSWLGEKNIEALRQAGGKGLVDRLTGDFARLAAQSRETVGDGWRLISLPMLHDEQLSQIQMFVRHQQDEQSDEQDGQDKKRTRFILNLDLSRMGSLQLDGLVFKKNLDIILRTNDKLSADIRQNILQKFHQGLDQTGYTGTLSFQSGKQGWIDIKTSPDAENDILA